MNQTISNLRTTPSAQVDASPLPSKRRKHSVTQTMGRAVFEAALHAEKKEQLANEVGYGVAMQPTRPVEVSRPIEIPKNSNAQPAESISEEAMGGSSEIERKSVSESSLERPEEAGDAEAVSEELREEEGALGLEMEAAETEPSEPAEEAQAIAAEPLSDESLHSDSGGGEGLQESFEEPSSSQDDTMEMDLPEMEFEVEMLAKATSSSNVVAIVESSGEGKSLPSGFDSAQTLNASYGKDAFARATSATRYSSDVKPAAALGATDLKELVDQIEKVRGSMTGSRARVVVGEGSERIAMIVSVKDGIVNVDLKASDTGVAGALTDNAQELAEALGQHGLTLGDMGGDANHSSEESSESEKRGDVSAAEEPAGRVATTSTLGSGVRVVA